MFTICVLTFILTEHIFLTEKKTQVMGRRSM